MKSEAMCPLRVYALIALLAFACTSKIVSANKFYRPLLRNERQRTTFLTNNLRNMGRFIIKLVRLMLKYGRFCLVCVNIQLNGNSQYVEYMNNEFKEEKPCLEKEEP